MKAALHQDGKTIIKFIIISIIAITIISYSLFQARNLINGPVISLSSPQTGQTVDNPLVAISGVARNITYITLNDRQIFVDENGLFKEELLLSPGYNIWTVQAKDKFGRVVSKRIELVLKKS